MTSLPSSETIEWREFGDGRISLMRTRNASHLYDNKPWGVRFTRFNDHETRRIGFDTLEEARACYDTDLIILMPTFGE